MLHRTKSNGVTVQATEDRNVFRVGVGAHAKRVDLEAANGLGWCECEDFAYRVIPLRNQGFKNATCKHIKAAFDGLGRIVSKTMSDQAGVRRSAPGDP